jgi:hypothetical protein
MNTTPEKYIERLNELLLKKRALLLDILSLTQAQTEAIAEDSLNSLDDLINSKGLKIDAVNKLDEEFGIYCLKLKSALGISKLDQLDATVLGGNASEGAKQLKGLTAGILDLIRSISEVEKGNSQKSNKLLEQFGNEIKKINQGRKANNAYKAGSAPGGPGAA